MPTSWLGSPYREAIAILPPALQENGKKDALKLAEAALAGSRVIHGATGKATIAAMKKVADAYAGAGRADEALPLLTELSTHDPKDKAATLKAAVLQVWFGKCEDHINTFRRAAAQAEAEGASANSAERAARIWCLHPPIDPAMRETALALARKAAKNGGDRLPSQLTLGMTEFRCGDDSAAEQALLVVDQDADVDPMLQGPARLFRAMCFFRAGKNAEALELFAQAKAQMKPLPSEKKNVLQNGADQDDLLFWIIYEEAKAMLKVQDR